MWEGAPDFPHKGVWWEIVERYGVTILYCAPTAIRACIKWGAEWPNKHDLSSLRLLGTVGEPINPEAWMWYHETIGGKRCPIVDTWWQTETGQAIVAFVTLGGDDVGDEEAIEGIRGTVAERIGKFARPKRIMFTDDLPKTRSGKIMRRLLRDIAEGRELGDVTTLRDPAVTGQLKERVAELQAQED